MLDERIGRNGGAMAEIGDTRGRRYVHVGGDAAHSLLDSIRNAARRIIGRGGYFPDLKPAFVLFKETDVRERPARVYPHTPARHCCCLAWNRVDNPNNLWNGRRNFSRGLVKVPPLRRSSNSPAHFGTLFGPLD